MTITVNDVCKAMEALAPLALQESYDNAGLLLGRSSMPLTGILLCIDITEEVMQEAQSKGCNMIVSHHPLIFKGIKSITGRNATERCIIQAITHNIAVYASHTNLDSVSQGVSMHMASKIGLKNCRILQPKADMLLKLVTFVPHSQLESVRDACFEAGAGHIGNYDSCSYHTTGTGTFRAHDSCTPYVGQIGQLHAEPESRLEVILPIYLKAKVTKALIQAHPYEEPAFDFIPLKNDWQATGFGVIGQLEQEESEAQFLNRVKKIFDVGCLKHTAYLNRNVKTVALCGGSGAELINTAISQAADVYITADIKYHDFFIPEKRILVADIGHFESEQFTKEIFYNQLTKNFPKFAIHFSEINTNPINFL